MLTLKPIKFKYAISTVYLELVYRDSSNAKVKVEAIPLASIDKQKFVTIEIDFRTVAEAKCITLNFYESNYENIYISKDVVAESSIREFEKNNHLESGFYEVLDSEYLQKNIKKYDPKGSLNLKHYIVTGYDGYVELLASKYSVNEIDS